MARPLYTAVAGGGAHTENPSVPPGRSTRKHPARNAPGSGRCRIPKLQVTASKAASATPGVAVSSQASPATVATGLTPQFGHKPGESSAISTRRRPARCRPRGTALCKLRRRRWCKRAQQAVKLMSKSLYSPEHRAAARARNGSEMSSATTVAPRSAAASATKPGPVQTSRR